MRSCVRLNFAIFVCSDTTMLDFMIFFFSLCVAFRILSYARRRVFTFALLLVVCIYSAMYVIISPNPTHSVTETTMSNVNLATEQLLELLLTLKVNQKKLF